MMHKIDNKLINGLILSNNEEAKVEYLIFVDNFNIFKNYIYRIKDSYLLSNIKPLPFINAFGLTSSYKSMKILAYNKNVVFISSQSIVSALINVSRKILNIEESHKLGFLGNDITICYIDTGLMPHLDFVLQSDRILFFKDMIGDRLQRYDDNGHGTFVTGIGSGNGLVSNGKFTGIAPKSNIISIKALSKNGEAGALSILQAMQWIYDNKRKYNIKVVCMSFGSEPMSFSDPIMRGAEELWNAGLVVVAAAGNSGPEHETIKSPGVSYKIITVGALDDLRDNDGNYNDKNFTIANFSSRGPAYNKFKPDIVSPGVKISSSLYNGIDFYDTLSGTSVSTPMIAGLCALFLQKNPKVSPGYVKQRLLRSCKPITYSKNDEGYGLPNALYFLN